MQHEFGSVVMRAHQHHWEMLVSSVCTRASQFTVREYWKQHFRNKIIHEVRLHEYIIFEKRIRGDFHFEG